MNINEKLREDISIVMYDKQFPKPLKVLEIEIIAKQFIQDQIKELKQELIGEEKGYNPIIDHNATYESGYNQKRQQIIEIFNKIK